MEQLLGCDGNLNFCYFFMRELEHCHAEELYPRTTCTKQREDYLECLNHNLYTKVTTELQKQLLTAKVIDVPHYDKQHDQFVFDSGKIVRNDDPMFSRFKWL